MVITIKDIVKRIRTNTIKLINPNIEISIKIREEFSFQKEDLQKISKSLMREAQKITNKLNKERTKRIALTAHLTSLCKEPQEMLKTVNITLSTLIAYLKVIDYKIQKLHEKTRC
ncbi:MAG TPA: hypothetical protein PLQ44_01870 [Candidatus Paceibacterota bacterium]|nr:hypothetical protein [Candidatus Paceibacterota bacterium]HPT40332.1 hypothetical protein [Candidatus Paceibacterota bacterium]